jgi:hypothetical protein
MYWSCLLPGHEISGMPFQPSLKWALAPSWMILPWLRLSTGKIGSINGGWPSYKFTFTLDTLDPGQSHCFVWWVFNCLERRWRLVHHSAYSAPFGKQTWLQNSRSDILCAVCLQWQFIWLGKHVWPSSHAVGFTKSPWRIHSNGWQDGMVRHDWQASSMLQVVLIQVLRRWTCSMRCLCCLSFHIEKPIETLFRGQLPIYVDYTWRIITYTHML